MGNGKKASETRAETARKRKYDWKGNREVLWSTFNIIGYAVITREKEK